MREPSDAELLTAMWAPANPFLPWAYLGREAKLLPWESAARVPLVDEPTDAQRHLWNLAGIAARSPFPVNSAVEWHRALIWAHLAEQYQRWWSLPEDSLAEIRRQRFADIWSADGLINDPALRLPIGGA